MEEEEEEEIVLGLWSSGQVKDSTEEMAPLQDCEMVKKKMF